MPAASEAVGAPGGGGGGGGDVEQEYEIRNDEGFVYKVPRGLYPDAAPSTTQSAAGPDPKAVGLRRLRRALLRLRDKRLRDLSRWEALASEHLAPLPAHQPPASPPASSHPVAAFDSSSVPDAAASSSSTSILDDLLVQVDLQTELMKKARQWCDDANAVCDAHEAAIFDSIAPLQLWGRNPSELMAGLCSPAASSGNLDEQNGRPEASGVSSAAPKKIPPLPLWGRNPSELMAGLCSPAASGNNLHEQNGCPEASGVSSAAAKKIKNSTKKQKMGHDPPPILTESRLRKRVTNVSGSNNVASQDSIEQKRKKALGSTSTAPGTPGSTRSKAMFTPARAPFIVGSPGALTRRRAAAKNESPGDS